MPVTAYIPFSFLNRNVTLVIQGGAIWPNFGHCTTTVNVWERIGEKTLSTILHSSWERGHVNLIISPITGWDVS